MKKHIIAFMTMIALTVVIACGGNGTPPDGGNGGGDTTIVDTTTTDTSDTDTTTTFGPVDRVVTKDTIAFVGAKGDAARTTTGGRGGKIYFIDNLNSAGPGSFHEFWTARGPRYGIPRISGYIEQDKPFGGRYYKLSTNDGDATYYGQLGVGDGLVITGYTPQIEHSNIILQYFKSRHGGNNIERGDMSDAIRINSPNNDVQNIIFDQSTFSSGIDENISAWRTVKNVTIQNCISAEALWNSTHPDGVHSMGLVFSKADGNSLNEGILVTGCYIVHNNARNGKFNDGTFRFQYNLVYNYGNYGIYISTNTQGDPKTHVDIVDVMFYEGDNTRGRNSAIELQNPRDNRTSFYVNNVRVIAKDGTEVAAYGSDSSPFLVDQPQTEPVPFAEFAGLSLEDAILSLVGASKPNRDAYDARVVQDFYERTSRRINSFDDLPGGKLPDLNPGTRYVDVDNDGMPDEWEVLNGYEVGVADHNENVDGDMFTNLEEIAYLARFYQLPYVKSD